jgi:MarR family transcriptional regulator, organic hydroperoxide resistance regulator
MSGTPGPGPAGGAVPRRDLAAMVVPLARALVAAEEPVLRAHQVSMWGYVVLNALAEQPVRTPSIRTQAALAQSIGADKSRIISVLDELQEHGLIERRPDPADRRVHLLALTEAGRRRRESVRAAIQRQEEERVLAALPEADRAAFIRALRILSELPPEDIRG